jgi:hypothetical protein
MWSLKYCLLVFISVLGVLQLAAARKNLRGLFFFPWKTVTVVFAGLAIAFPLVVFFTWNEFHSRIIEGSQQTGSFVVSAAAGIIFTVLLSSLLNFRRLNAGGPQTDGMDALQTSTFIQVLLKRWSRKAR